MDKNTLTVSQALHDYIRNVSLRESEVLKALRDETAKDEMCIMQITPEQGQFMALLVKMLGAKRTLEIGTYTGYSTLCVAMAMADDSLTIACDVDKKWTAIASRYWKQAKVENKIDLRIKPALETLNEILNEGMANSFDFAFIDADKSSYDTYYEKTLQLLRPGGVMAIDNVFLFGSVLESDECDKQNDSINIDRDSIRALNIKIKNDPRVDISMLPVADGLTLALKV